MRRTPDQMKAELLGEAEDGDGIIVRLIETEGEEVAATVTLPHLTITNLML